jgi:hypothetical protein
MAKARLLNDTTGTGGNATFDSKSNSGAVMVRGNANDTIILQCQSGADDSPARISTIEPSDLEDPADGEWFRFMPAPSGTYSVKRSGQTDSVDVVVEV